MKLSLFPLLALGSLLTSLAALPVEMQNLVVRDEFEVKREEQADIVSLEKRESKALTGFLSSLNRTGAGVFFVRNAANSPGINNAIIRRIGGIFEDDEIEEFLRHSGNAGLATDLVLMFLTHWELYDGLTDMVHYYRGTKPSETGSLLVAMFRLVFGNLFGGGSASSLSSVFSLLSGSSGNASASGFSGLSDLLLAGSSSESGSSSRNSSGSSGSGSLDEIFTLGGSSSSESSPVNSDPVSSPINSAVTSAPLNSPVTSPVDSPATSAPVKSPVTSAAPVGSTPTNDIEDDFEEDTEDDRTLAEQFGEVASDVASFFKRSIKDPEAAHLEAQPLARRVNRILKRMDEEEDSAVAALGDYNDAWDETVRVMEEDDLDALGLIISLQKSGLGLSIVHDALTDSRWHRFNKSLIEYLLENDLLVLQKLLRDLLNSGVVWTVLGDILGSGENIRIVLNFVRGLLSGDINILGLLRAILT